MKKKIWKVRRAGKRHTCLWKSQTQMLLFTKIVDSFPKYTILVSEKSDLFSRLFELLPLLLIHYNLPRLERDIGTV